MSLARFYSRIIDAITPLLTGTMDLQVFLEDKLVCLEAPTDLEKHPVHVAGFVLATNLCARLYPRLRILGPPSVVEACESYVLEINPLCEVNRSTGSPHGVLSWAVSPQSDSAVVIAPAGWHVLLDQIGSSQIQSSNILVALAAAAIGVGELFRCVFAEFLPSGRRQPSPSKFNLLTLDDSTCELPELPRNIDIGQVHLVGAGAIGQAMIYALARVSVSGKLVVVDPEQITLSNLQRYVLTKDCDVDASKCSLVVRALEGSKLQVLCREVSWGDESLITEGEIETVCTAVDTEEARIGVQAGLPRSIYNAWTQPADLGFSRHEEFGILPCLACLYWPNRARPNEDELIASTLQQDTLRILSYLTNNVPVNQPLRTEQIPQLQNRPFPASVLSWIERSLLDDLSDSLRITAESRVYWEGKHLRDLYREGICGGALIRSNLGGMTQEMAVPLAHQSILAGIMLATQLLVACSPELRPFRSSAVEGRLNVLRSLPQTVIRPRQRSQNCLCSDPDFLARYRSKWD